MKLTLATSLFLSVLLSQVMAQTPDSALNKNIRIWSSYAGTQKPDIFIHLDKALYLPTENIFFTGYLHGTSGDSVEHHTMYVVLINLAARKIVASDRFVLENGISSGSLAVPDTAENGEYLFIAYTDRMLNEQPDQFCRRQIRIKQRTKPAFQQTVSLASDEKDSVSLKCRITTDYGGLATGGIFKYTLYGDGHLLRSGKTIIDAFGGTVIKLPWKDTLFESVILTTEISRNKNLMHLWTPVILKPDQILVNYYPEGGALADDHPARVGIEVRKRNGMGISGNGILLEDGQEIARFSTDTYGLGSISSRFRNGRQYTIRMAALPAGTYLCGQFPPVAAHGFTMRIENAVVREALDVKVFGPSKDSRCMIIVYSDHEILYSAKLGLRNDSGVVSIPVKDWPRGIIRVGLYSNGGDPVAERAVFLPGAKESVTITTDSAVYHTRSKVQMRIKVSDEQGRGIMGMFSFASVLSSRLGLASLPDIARQINFDQYLPPGHRALPPLNYFNSDSLTNLILLTRFQAQSHWAEIKKQASEIQPPLAASEDYGHVLLNDKKLRQPVPLLLLGPSMYKFDTDSSGSFRIPHKELIAPYGSNPVLSVIGKKNQLSYRIVVENQYDTLNTICASAWYSPSLLSEDTSMRADEKTSPEFNAVKTLKEVVISSNGNNDNFYSQDGCQDYVCINNVLNCRNHTFGGRKPQIGQRYSYGGGGPYSTGNSTMIYEKCISCNGCGTKGSFVGAVHGIHQMQEFYNTDSVHFSPTEPALLSTLHWQPVIITDKNGEAVITFYTNDLKGRFYNIVQGVSENGPITGRYAFTVKD